MGKQAPPPPNYQGAAQQQAQSSQQNVGAQTTANRANQTNALGATSQWTVDPATGQWTQQSSLGGPLGQAAGSLEQQVMQGAGQPLDNGLQAGQQAAQTLYGSERAMLDPQWQQASEQNQAQLANQGLDPTSAAARAQNNQFNAAQNQAYSQAMGNAMQLLPQEQQVTFGENLAQRQLPLQQLGALQGLAGQSGYNAAGLAEPMQALEAANLGGNYGLQAANFNAQQMGELGQGIGGLMTSLPFLL